MADKNETTAQTFDIGQMVQAEVIREVPPLVTASGVQSVRTVATSLTTGEVSIRYVPRPVQSGGSAETTS